MRIAGERRKKKPPGWLKWQSCGYPSSRSCRRSMLFERLRKQGKRKREAKEEKQRAKRRLVIGLDLALNKKLRGKKKKEDLCSLCEVSYEALSARNCV
jgi:hypothetical protein